MKSKIKNVLIKIIVLILPQKTAHKIIYRLCLNKKLDYNNLIDFNEKIQYLIVNKYGSNEGNLADKYKVKEYVENLKIKDLKVPKTLGVYEKANEIDINKLPSQFVLKCNHGSGNVFICKNKENFNIKRAKKILNKSLKEKFYLNLGEYHYKYIKPLIIAEEYLDDSKNINPIDYKFYCKNGKVQSILVCSERNESLRLDEFDRNWVHLEDTYKNLQSKKSVPRPKKLNEMVEIAEKLSKNIKFVRVDLYEINGKIYFGEYTFTPAGGLITYYTKEALIKHGEYIEI